MTFDWLVSAGNLCFGDAGTIVRWDKTDEIPVDLPSGAVVATEIENYRPIACLDAFSAGKLKVRGMLVRAPHLAIARRLTSHTKENLRSQIFGVLCDYYTCHVPVGDAGSRVVFRYCFGLRRGGGMTARVKQFVKVALAELGFGPVLCDYFLVFIERASRDY